MRYYRLEFNEKKQHFHLANANRKPNTFGWITVFERCTDDEFWIFKSFLHRVEKKHLTKKYVLDSAIKLERFHNKLIENKLKIEKS